MLQFQRQWQGKRDCLLNRVSERSAGTRRELEQNPSNSAHS